MKVYKNSLMDFYYPDERVADTDIPCIVKLTNDSCTVKYDAREVDGAELFWEWTGQAIGAGHFQLKAHKNCTASLHMFKDSKVMDGYWKEQGLHGMWRITLKE